MTDPTPDSDNYTLSAAMAEDLAFARTVFDALVHAWVKSGRPMPATVVRARGILDRALACVMSLERHDIGEDGGESDSDNIGTDEVAALLGVHRRSVQRKAESLGGQRISGAWVFDRSDIRRLEDG